MKHATRLSILGVVAFALLGQTHHAFADAKSECIATNESAQFERDSHHLIRARELYRECSNDRCPSVIRKDCAAAAADLDKRIPSVVARVKNPEGADLVNVRGVVDGQVAPELSDGRELILDPGKHKLRFEVDGYLPVDVDLIAVAGERRRAVDVVMKPEQLVPVKAPATAPTPVPAVADSTSGVPTGAYVVGGIGLVFLGVGAGFYYAGLQQRSDDISSGCATQSECDDQKSGIRTKLVVGDVLAGLGVVGVVTGVVWAFNGQGQREAVRSPEGTALVDVRPTRGGALASASITF